MDQLRQKEEKKNRIITIVLWSVLTVSCMTAMLVFASNKTIVIADAAKEQSVITGTQPYGMAGEPLLLEQQGTAQGEICIPLPKGVKAESVVMENRYTDHELWISIEGAEDTFYAEHAVYGDISPITEARFESKKESVILKFELSDIYEYRSTMENDELTVVFGKPHEWYDLIVVVDPMGDVIPEDGGGVESAYEERSAIRITLDVAAQLQKQLEQEKIRLYFTRLENREVSDEEKRTLLEQTGADLYIALGVSADHEDGERYGIQGIYNEEFFIPEFGNVELADVLTRNVTISSSNRAVGLMTAGDNSFLRQVGICAAQVSLGYLTNAREAELLGQEAYRAKLAEGLANAILEVYTNTDKNNAR